MLRLENVTIRFGGLVAVNEVTAAVQEGQIFGLIGPNGAGKTTLFNIITGVYAPTAGKVVFQGHEIQGKRPHTVNQLGIARTYQNINLFQKMTVLENVLVGTHSRTKAGLVDAVFNTKSKRAEEEAAAASCMGFGNALKFFSETIFTISSPPIGQSS